MANTTEQEEFTNDILEGLKSDPKTLPSKYFYDKRGDKLFQQIMQLDEYYLTNAEYQILEQNAAELLQHFTSENATFNLIELGAGDGYKTKVLLRHFLQQKTAFTYVPIDISENAINTLSGNISKELPDLTIKPLVMDFFQGLDFLGKQKTERKVVLFLGSSIGNFPHEDAQQLLAELHKRLSPGDLLLTGFDLRKDPEKILAAYNDSDGVTREFNLNLLDRINHESGADFNRESFIHYPIYDPLAGEARSYLISTKKQEVYFPQQETIIHLDAWEAIHTEVSRKYSIKQTDKIAREAGFVPLKHFTDPGNLFLDALWQKK